MQKKKKKMFLVVHIVMAFVSRCSILLVLVECSVISLHASILVVTNHLQAFKEDFPKMSN